MQELLGRIAALDPDASLGIRVISCFDELILGRVNTDALLRTAAALAGCPAGFQADRGSSTRRIGPKGRPLQGPAPGRWQQVKLPDDSCVWLERDGDPQPNDKLILERLSIAVGVRRGVERDEREKPRDVGILLDSDVETEWRAQAAARLGLEPDSRRAVLAVPLFAVWEARHRWPGDVISTDHGPVHALLLPEGRRTSDMRGAVRPAGVGPALSPSDLHRSFTQAVAALRLTTPGEPIVAADTYGGLLASAAESERLTTEDDRRLERLMEHSWASAVLPALVNSTSVRQAAKSAGMHHSTMQSHVEALTRALGFSPMDGLGQARLGLAHLKWRLRTSAAFSAPPPSR